MSAISSSIAGPRWPIIGSACASRTSCRTSVGPGRKNFPKGGRSVIVVEGKGLRASSGTAPEHAQSGVVERGRASGGGRRADRQGKDGHERGRAHDQVRGGGDRGALHHPGKGDERVYG